MNRFSVTDTAIPGLKLVERKMFGDERGFLSRLFCSDELLAVGWTRPIAQINHTLTVQCGTVRGLHYQRVPHAEAKLVSCLRGRVWDVAVDLRPDSPTYLAWFGANLSRENGCALLIPEGVAHGFQTLCDDVEMLYCHSAAYAPEFESGIDALDRQLAIKWPLPVSVRSARDLGLAPINSDFRGVCL